MKQRTQMHTKKCCIQKIACKENKIANMLITQVKYYFYKGAKNPLVVYKCKYIITYYINSRLCYDYLFKLPK